MKLGALKPGMSVPNYRALCALLEEGVKAGNSKKAQIAEWERYFAYERNKNAYVITEIYDTPKLGEDGRQRFGNLIEPILLNHLSQQREYKDGMSWNDWFRTLGMVSERFFSNTDREEYLNFYKPDTLTFSYTINCVHQKMRAALQSALNTLSKKGRIRYTSEWVVVTMWKGCSPATEKQRSLIEETRRAVMEEMGYSSMFAITASPKRFQEYSRITHERLRDGLNASNVFVMLSIQALDDTVLRFREMDVGPQKSTLSNEIIESVRAACLKAEKKNRETTMEAWENEAEKIPICYSPFFLGESEMILEELATD